jgi:hypothetical protein
MCTIATAPAAAPGGEPSAYGGLVVLRQVWEELDGDGLVASGLRWRGHAGALLLFALVALPVLGCASVRAVAQCCGRVRDPLWRVLAWTEAVSQRRLARFVSSERHDWAALQAAMVARLAQHPATALAPPAGADDPAGGIVAVDSTVVEKRFGPRLPGVRPVYDNVRRGLVDGWEIVSGCVVGPRGAWPLGLLPHRPPGEPRERAPRRRRKAQPGEAPSKLDLALQLVEWAVRAAVGAPTVVGDGAFAVNWWLREVEGRALHWLVATRHDRRLRIGAEVAAFATWVQQLPLVLTCVASAPEGGGVYGCLLPRATLLDKGCRRNGLSCRPAYCERRDAWGRVQHRWYLVTSQTSWDLPTLWRHWQWRWPVESFHRDAKQWLQLAAMHGRSWAGLVAWLACCSVRASLLAALRVVEPTCAGWSTEALVQALRTAACQVTVPAGTPPTVSLPPALPATHLAARAAPPDPRPWWPLRLPEAA